MICTPCQEHRHRMCEGGDCQCPKRLEAEAMAKQDLQEAIEEELKKD